MLGCLTISVLHPVCRGCYLRMLLEEMVEMSGVLKTQAIADFRDIPLGVFEQHFGFTGQPVGNVVAGGFARGEPYGAIQVVDVNGQVLSKIPRRAKSEALCGRFDWELSFQEFAKNGRDPRVGIRMLV